MQRRVCPSSPPRTARSKRACRLSHQTDSMTRPFRHARGSGQTNRDRSAFAAQIGGSLAANHSPLEDSFAPSYWITVHHSVGRHLPRIEVRSPRAPVPTAFSPYSCGLEVKPCTLLAPRCSVCSLILALTRAGPRIFLPQSRGHALPATALEPHLGRPRPRPLLITLPKRNRRTLPTRPQLPAVLFQLSLLLRKPFNSLCQFPPCDLFRSRPLRNDRFSRLSRKPRCCPNRTSRSRWGRLPRAGASVALSSSPKFHWSQPVWGLAHRRHVVHSPLFQDFSASATSPSRAVASRASRLTPGELLLLARPPPRSKTMACLSHNCARCPPLLPPGRVLTQSRHVECSRLALHASHVSVVPSDPLQHLGHILLSTIVT
jgi:hypothetical protein